MLKYSSESCITQLQNPIQNKVYPEGAAIEATTRIANLDIYTDVSSQDPNSQTNGTTAWACFIKEKDEEQKAESQTTRPDHLNWAAYSQSSANMDIETVYSWKSHHPLGLYGSTNHHHQRAWGFLTHGHAVLEVGCSKPGRGIIVGGEILIQPGNWQCFLRRTCHLL